MSEHDPDPASGELDDAVHPDPVVRFSRWLSRARARGLVEPTAMTLATADAGGRPSARIVLLKGHDDRGFVFATNTSSRKAAELRDNPQASLVFHWQPLGLQVRIEGRVETVDDAESDRLFAARPRESQLSAWASRQSRPLPDHKTLEAEVEALRRRFPAAVPRPPFWGGYRLRPRCIEFWRHDEHRRHHRLLYAVGQHGAWTVRRLAP